MRKTAWDVTCDRKIFCQGGNIFQGVNNIFQGVNNIHWVFPPPRWSVLCKDFEKPKYQLLILLLQLAGHSRCVL